MCLNVLFFPFIKKQSVYTWLCDLNPLSPLKWPVTLKGKGDQIKCCVGDLWGWFDEQAPPGEWWSSGGGGCRDIVLRQCELSLLFVINLPFKVFLVISCPNPVPLLLPPPHLLLCPPLPPLPSCPQPHGDTKYSFTFRSWGHSRASRERPPRPPIDRSGI